jgi:plasmid stabilization system protein ParE
MQLLIAESAFNDLTEIKVYFKNLGVTLVADKFIAEIIKHVEILEDHPEIGRMVPDFSVPTIRELIHTPN